MCRWMQDSEHPFVSSFILQKLKNSRKSSVSQIHFLMYSKWLKLNNTADFGQQKEPTVSMQPFCFKKAMSNCVHCFCHSKLLLGFMLQDKFCLRRLCNIPYCMDKHFLKKKWLCFKKCSKQKLEILKKVREITLCKITYIFKWVNRICCPTWTRWVPPPFGCKPEPSGWHQLTADSSSWPWEWHNTHELLDIWQQSCQTKELVKEKTG